MLEHRLERAVGEDLLVRGRIAQLALRSIQLVPLVADLAPYEVDRAPIPINEHTAVELLVDTAAVLGRMLVVERFAQVLQLSVGKSWYFARIGPSTVYDVPLAPGMVVVAPATPLLIADVADDAAEDIADEG